MNNVILIISTGLGTFQLDKPNCQSETIQVYLKESYVQNKKVRQIDYRTPIAMYYGTTKFIAFIIPVAI